MKAWPMAAFGSRAARLLAALPGPVDRRACTIARKRTRQGGDGRLGARAPGRRRTARTLLSALALPALAGACVEREGRRPGVYVSESYGFEIAFPDTLDVREFTPRYLALGRSDGDAFRAAVEVVLETGEAESFEAFAFERARSACSVEGPDLSTACLDAHRVQPFQTASGVSGTSFFLRHVTTRARTAELVAEGLRGPFVVFDLSPARPLPEGLHVVLFVRAPVVLAPGASDPELVRSGAGSLQLPAAP